MEKQRHDGDDSYTGTDVEQARPPLRVGVYVRINGEGAMGNTSNLHGLRGRILRAAAEESCWIVQLELRLDGHLSLGEGSFHSRWLDVEAPPHWSKKKKAKHGAKRR